ncbi:MAG: fructose 1,6-bisphosphatase [Microbacterium sp.]|uniref:fructose 1,6-bisphosphatase n=1 Tax=Microbacterium sp. TaxID=51671 RepID=UPI0026268360|nr:fructose 1,6-bisphosphatase [Microbacterium sp.]MCX6501344.1 fructose 1,6-bisphosphatase [Microbacterium sp.]
MHTRPTGRRLRRIAATAALALLGTTALSGCTQIVDAFNNLQGKETGIVSTPAPSPSASLVFNSQFTYDGSVSLTSDVADDLVVHLDVWAEDPKRTQQWTPNTDKTFGFAINVFDNRVDDKAVLAEKRRVYISSVKITAQTAQTSGQTQTPYQFTADPRTLVPTDTLRSDQGLLINHFQGGLLIEGQTIHQLPADTYGLTLEFAFTVAVEGTPNTDSSFQQQVIYQYLPIAIYAD